MKSITLNQLELYFSQDNFFIIDEKVFHLYFEKKSFLLGKNIYLLKNAEQDKCFDTYIEITNKFLQAGIRRNKRIIAIGGGATTDLAGFVASTILRGIDWVAVPTTLLAMVDASIGGKVGINTSVGKNMVGQFHLPSEVLINETFLDTLPDHEYQSGLGEIVKYGFLSRNINTELGKGFSPTVISMCNRYKMEVVEEDFSEKGSRIKLNFGHTIGHGIEKVTGLPHGLAVLKGMEINIKLFSPNLLDDFNKFCEVLNLTVPNNLNMDKDQFFDYLKMDKKNTSSKISIIIIKEIGKYDTIEVDKEMLIKKLDECGINTSIFK